MKNAPVVAYPDDEEEIEYDSDGNPIAPEKSKVLNYVLWEIICMRKRTFFDLVTFVQLVLQWLNLSRLAQ